MTGQRKLLGLCAGLLLGLAAAMPARADTPTGQSIMQAQTGTQSQAQSGQGADVPQMVCRRVRRCRRVVGCTPYFSNPWNCYRNRSCRTVRECYPVGRGAGRHEF